MIPFEAIQNVAGQIAKAFNPEKIVLFGSYAYGVPTENSDVDMLVILPYEVKGALKTVEIIHTVNPAIPVDLLVRSMEQISERIRLNDFFLREIMEKGKILYEAAH